MNRFQATCYTLACALAGTVALPTTLAHAADDTPVVAPTRYANDLFGGSMAVDGDTLLVGAAGSSEYAFHTGEVHVFHSSAGAWNKVDSIGPVDPTSTVLFGQNLALSGEHAMVTSWDNSKNQAVLDFFHRTNMRWEAVAQLRSSRFADFTVDNDLAVVATYERTILLEWVATHWREKTVLPATFESVALSGEALLLAQNENLSVFEHNTGTWQELGPIEFDTRRPYTLVAEGSTALFEDVLLERAADGMWTVGENMLEEAGLTDEPNLDLTRLDITPAIESSRITIHFNGRLAEFEQQATGEWRYSGELHNVGENFNDLTIARVGEQVLVGKPYSNALGYESGVVHVYETLDSWRLLQHLLPDGSSEDYGGCSIRSRHDTDGNHWALTVTLLLTCLRSKRHKQRRQRRYASRFRQVVVVGVGFALLWLGMNKPAQACSESYPEGLFVDRTEVFLDQQPLPTNGVIVVPARGHFWINGEPDPFAQIEVWDGDGQKIPGTVSVRLVDQIPPLTESFNVRYIYLWQPESELIANHAYQFRVANIDHNGGNYEYPFVTADGPHTDMAGELQVELTAGIEVAEVVESACCELSRTSCGTGSFCIPTTEGYGPALHVSATISGLDDTRMVRFWVARLTPDGTQLPSASFLTEETDIDDPDLAGYPTLPIGQLQQNVLFPTPQPEYCVVVGATSMIDGQSVTSTECVSHSAETEPMTTTLATADILDKFAEYEAGAEQACLSPALYKSNGEPVRPEEIPVGCKVANTPGTGLVYLTALALIRLRRRSSSSGRATQRPE